MIESSVQTELHTKLKLFPKYNSDFKVLTLSGSRLRQKLKFKNENRI